ncbi:Secretion system C-terminal sorting domain-containing protein [Flavobacterium longum]|uniref:T9SS type A sorting domain-containing protein n=1 Tax=Flavobacterium longum TaxID=1299340 RepID=UPI0039EA9A15
MKKIYVFMAALCTYAASAQNTTVTYTASTESFANPERGFYQHEETFASNYDPLSQSSLTNYRVNNKQTLILRLFYLDSFINSEISSAFLTAMQTDFTRMRAAGIKCIIRFAYSDDVDNPQQDATKAQVLAHIAQLKPVLLANGDVIATVQAGFIGTWGEWYYTDHFGLPPNATDYANRKEVVTALVNALPAGRMVQVRTPKLKQQMFNAQAGLSLTQAFTTATIARVGHHNDCFLASEDDEGTYDNITSDYAYLEQETKYTPMGGESCAVNAPRSLCPTALAELQKFHWSYANIDYHPGVLGDWQEGGCFTDVEKKLGYRFEMKTGTFPNSASIGGIMPVELKIANVGFASLYNPRTAYLVFRNVANNAEYSVAINSDPRFWSSNATTTINDNIVLPTTMTAGSYKLFLKLPDADAVLAIRPEYSVRMANQTTWEATTGYNDLKHTVTVGTALGVGENDIRTKLVVYPVPANNELIMELDNITDYSVSVYNTLGQRIGVSSRTESTNKMIVNTESLSNGIYFVSLENGTAKVTKQIIVNH